MGNWIFKYIRPEDFLYFFSILIFGVMLYVVIVTPTPDKREFGDIVKQCQEMGYIQDKVTRITCSVEK